MYSGCDNCCSQQLGFPIRTSPDHRLLASPRSLSQLATSFIAYLRQGIHTHALSSLTIKFTLDTVSRSALDLKYGLTRPLLNRSDAEIRINAVKHLLLALHAVYCLHDVFCNLCCPSIFNCQRTFLKNSGVRIQESESSCILPTDFWLLYSSFGWWAWVESNYRPHPYQGCALAN